MFRQMPTSPSTAGIRKSHVMEHASTDKLCDQSLSVSDGIPQRAAPGD